MASGSGRRGAAAASPVHGLAAHHAAREAEAALQPSSQLQPSSLSYNAPPAVALDLRACKARFLAQGCVAWHGFQKCWTEMNLGLVWRYVRQDGSNDNEHASLMYHTVLAEVLVPSLPEADEDATLLASWVVYALYALYGIAESKERVICVTPLIWSRILHLAAVLDRQRVRDAVLILRWMRQHHCFVLAQFRIHSSLKVCDDKDRRRAAPRVWHSDVLFPPEIRDFDHVSTAVDSRRISDTAAAYHAAKQRVAAASSSQDAPTASTEDLAPRYQLPLDIASSSFAQDLRNAVTDTLSSFPSAEYLRERQRLAAAQDAPRTAAAVLREEAMEGSRRRVAVGQSASGSTTPLYMVSPRSPAPVTTHSLSDMPILLADTPSNAAQNGRDAAAADVHTDSGAAATASESIPASTDADAAGPAASSRADDAFEVTGAAPATPPPQPPQPSQAPPPELPVSGRQRRSGPRLSIRDLSVFSSPVLQAALGVTPSQEQAALLRQYQQDRDARASSVAAEADDHELTSMALALEGAMTSGTADDARVTSNTGSQQTAGMTAAATASASSRLRRHGSRKRPAATPPPRRSTRRRRGR